MGLPRSDANRRSRVGRSCGLARHVGCRRIELRTLRPFTASNSYQNGRSASRGRCPCRARGAFPGSSCDRRRIWPLHPRGEHGFIWEAERLPLAYSYNDASNIVSSTSTITGSSANGTTTYANDPLHSQGRGEIPLPTDAGRLTPDKLNQLGQDHLDNIVFHPDTVFARNGPRSLSPGGWTAFAPNGYLAIFDEALSFRGFGAW